MENAHNQSRASQENQSTASLGRASNSSVMTCFNEHENLPNWLRSSLISNNKHFFVSSTSWLSFLSPWHHSSQVLCGHSECRRKTLCGYRPLECGATAPAILGVKLWESDGERCCRGSFVVSLWSVLSMFSVRQNKDLRGLPQIWTDVCDLFLRRPTPHTNTET